MGTISRRELIRIAAASAVTLPSAGTPATTTRVEAANRPRAPQFAVAEQVPEVFTSLPFGSQELRGALADRMRINVEGRLLRIDADACLSGFVRRDGAGSFDAAWVGEHAGKFLDPASNALRSREDAEAVIDAPLVGFVNCAVGPNVGNCPLGSFVATENCSIDPKLLVL